MYVLAKGIVFSEKKQYNSFRRGTIVLKKDKKVVKHTYIKIAEFMVFLRILCYTVSR